MLVFSITAYELVIYLHELLLRRGEIRFAFVCLAKSPDDPDISSWNRPAETQIQAMPLALQKDL